MNPHLSTLNSSLIIFKQTSLFKTFLDKAEIEMNKLLYVDFFAAHSTMNQAMRSTIERRSLLMDSITLFNQATTKLEKEKRKRMKYFSYYVILVEYIVILNCLI